MAEIGYIDFNSIPDSDDFASIPAGDYTVSIEDSVVSDNKKGNGKYVKFTFQVLDGQYKGYLLWHYVNYKHVNVITQRIGLKELKEIGLACGKTQFTDTSILHGIPFRIRVDIEKDNLGEARNVVTKILWKETSSAPRPPVAAPVIPEDDNIPF
jgi:hypothetical protein